MPRFYFTYGTDERYPFCGGWTEVSAANIYEAQELFREHHPDIHKGMLNCADYYTYGQMYASGMLETRNFGYACHEIIDADGVHTPPGVRRLSEGGYA